MQARGILAPQMSHLAPPSSSRIVWICCVLNSRYKTNQYGGCRVPFPLPAASLMRDPGQIFTMHCSQFFSADQHARKVISTAWQSTRETPPFTKLSKAFSLFYPRWVKVPPAPPPFGVYLGIRVLSHSIVPPSNAGVHQSTLGRTSWRAT